MAEKKDLNKSYDKLRDALKTGQVGRCYVFHGQEQYLLADSLTRLRALLCPDGQDGFNYKRFDTGNFSAQVLEEAAQMLPFNAERTMIEVHEHDFFKGDEDERNRMCTVLKNLPEHVCVVFVFSVTVYKPDGRLKTVKEMLKNIEVIDFAVQDTQKLTRWIIKHFNDAGKTISEPDAAYLVQITGGQMTTLCGEIEKITAYAKQEQIKRSDIDDVVTPVLDAAAYKLTDAIVRRDKKGALQTLDKLLEMREDPHKLMFHISLKMRQLLAARVCLDNNISKVQFMEMCGIFANMGFVADTLLATARKTTLHYCKNAVLMCARTAKQLNSMSEPEAQIIELILCLLSSDDAG